VYPQQPEQKPGILERITGILVLVVILLITSLTIVIGYVLNTVWDYNLQNTPLFGKLPAAAQAVFGTTVSYTLTTYGFIVGIVILIAISGTIAAIFGLRSRPEDTEDY
jgi:uncharacterized BrkB/YihY/UPF0761 family membrane protein